MSDLGRAKSIHRSRVLPLLASSPRTVKKYAPRPTPENPLIVSASEMRDFLRCRTKWAWRHMHRLEPVRGGEALAFGSLVHQILETWYKFPRAKRKISRMERIADQVLKVTTWRQLNDQDFELIRAMCVGYAAWAKPLDKEIGLDVGRPEQEFCLPLNKEKTIYIRGKIDNNFDSITYRKTVGAFEFKTAGQIRQNDVERTLQLSVYLWALRQLYPRQKRYIAYWRVLRKQMPGPRVKADLFHQEEVERSDDEVRQWAIDAENIALDMLDAAIYPTPDDSCAWGCDFNIACLVRGNQDDLQNVLTSAFREKEYRP